MTAREYADILAANSHLHRPLSKLLVGATEKKPVPAAPAAPAASTA